MLIKPPKKNREAVPGRKRGASVSNIPFGAGGFQGWGSFGSLTGEKNRLYTTASAIDRGSQNGVDFSLLDGARRFSRVLWRSSNILSALDRFIDDDVVGNKLNLKLPKEIDQKTKTIIADRWERWGHSCGGGSLSFTELVSLILRNTARDGDALVIFGKNESNEPRPQLLESDAVNGVYTGSLNIPAAVKKKMAGVRGGVVQDSFYNVLGYFVSENIMESSFVNTFGKQSNDPQQPPRFIPADEAVLFCRKTSSVVHRGLPIAAGVMHKLIQIENNDIARLSSSTKEASMFVFLESPVEATAGFSAVSSLNPADDGGVTADANKSPALSKLPGADTSGLTACLVQPGTTAKVFNSQSRGAEMTSFVTALLSRVCASLGLPYQTLTRDFNAPGFGTSRQVQVAERDYAEKSLGRISSQVLRPLFKQWAFSALLDLNIAPEAYEKMLDTVSLVGKPTPWIDPRAESAATAQALESGTTTREHILQENGSSLTEFYQAIADEKALAESMGVPVFETAQQPAPPQADEEAEPPQPPPKNNDNDDDDLDEESQ